MREKTELLLRRIRESPRYVLVLVFFAFLLDSALVTSIVPILPNIGAFRSVEINPNGSYRRVNETDFHLVHNNVQLGTILASKAITQLFANVLIGYLGPRMEFSTIAVSGCALGVVTSIVYTFAENYWVLLLGRIVHGVGSACIGVAGYTRLACHYQDDVARSRAMGVAIGGIGVGVIVGYPLGGVLYSLVGQWLPFSILTILFCIETALMLLVSDDGKLRSACFVTNGALLHLLKDRFILIGSGCIFLSTLSMGIIEVVLPLWMMDTMHPTEWQLGTVFVPDSIGFFIGANVFGFIGTKIGRSNSVILGLVFIAFWYLLIPIAKKVTHLVIPHLGFGFGMGIIDASVIPFLGHLVDIRHNGVYEAVYTVQQFAVSLGFSLGIPCRDDITRCVLSIAGPLLGGILPKVLSYSWIIRSVAMLLLIYAPVCLYLRKAPTKDENKPLMEISSASMGSESSCAMSTSSRSRDRPATIPSISS